MNVTSSSTACCSHKSHAHHDARHNQTSHLSDTQQSQLKDLFASAVEAREDAYAPNSKFKVGAALLARDGSVYLGSNKEFTINADHAEQRVVNEALLAGQKPEDLMAVAVFGARGGVTDKNFESRISPCGNCRQALHELNPEMLAVGADGLDNIQAYLLKDELPDAYYRKKDLPESPKAVKTGDKLLDGALEARSHSHVPRSKSPVGAAVETDKGIFIGARVEVSSYASQAARMALGAAMEAGATIFHRLAIIGGSESDKFVRPNDLPFDTFEALYKIAPEAQVVLPNANGLIETHQASNFPRFLMNTASY